MLTCKEVTEHASALLDGELSFWARLQVRMHVAMCRHCTAFLQQLKTVKSLLQELPSARPSEAARTELLRAFAARSRTTPRER